MKRATKIFLKIAITLLIAVLCIPFAACDMEFIENGFITGGGGSGGGSGGGDPGGDAELDRDAFTVSLINEDGSAYHPVTNVYVVWISQDGYSASNRVKFNSDGFAKSVNALDGEYYITITGLPSSKGYNANVYTADNFNRNVEVEVFDVIEVYEDVNYKAQGGTNWYDDVIRFRAEGYFRFRFTRSNQTFKCRFEPTLNGVYEFESMSNIYTNDVNPWLTYYLGNQAYVNLNSGKLYNSGGVSSSYTKNFLCSAALTDETVGSCFFYEISCDARCDYPVYVDFRLQRTDDFMGEDGSYSLYLGEENFYQSDGVTLKSFPTGSFRFFSGVLNHKTTAYSDPAKGGDGYYHMLNEDGSLGGYVYGMIKGSIRVSADSSLSWQDEEHISVTDYSTKLDWAFLLRGISNIRSQTSFGVYTQAELNACEQRGMGYYDYCTSKGVNYYPVTKELRKFYQDYCADQMLFYDGQGTLETDMGYVSDHESMWMVFCGYMT